MEITPALIQAVLETPFWLPTLETNRQYIRVQDDHDGLFDGRIEVSIDQMGDVWFVTDKHLGPHLRFRTFGGGGMSLRTRNALVILAEAIRLDNNDNEEINQGRVA
jgi:hypothetical protein